MKKFLHDIFLIALGLIAMQFLNPIIHDYLHNEKYGISIKIAYLSSFLSIIPLLFCLIKTHFFKHIIHSYNDTENKKDLNYKNTSENINEDEKLKNRNFTKETPTFFGGLIKFLLLSFIFIPFLILVIYKFYYQLS